MGDFNYEREFRNWEWEIPEDYNIGFDCVDKHTLTNKKNKVALYWEDSKGDSEIFTFNDMKNLTNRFGNTLKNLGFKKSDRLLIRLPNLPEFHISFLGGVKIGAIPIPSSVLLREKEIEYRINDSESKAIITTSKYVEEVNKIFNKCRTLKHIIIVDDAYGDQLAYEELMKKSTTKLKIESTKKDDIAFFCYTSGKTDSPKGVVHLQQWVPGNDPNILYWQQARNDDVLTHTGDLNWIYPLGNGFLYPWRHGFSTFIYNGRFNPLHWFELLEKYRVTNLASYPTAYHKFLTVKDPMKKYDLSALRHCISAGEQLSQDIIQLWGKKIGLDIYEGIGMTEIMVYISNYKGKKIKPGSYGKPQPGRICSVVDHEGNKLPQGEPGILSIKKGDPGLFKKYWNKPEKTKERFKKGWFLTGDILYQDEEGYYWPKGSDNK